MRLSLTLTAILLLMVHASLHAGSKDTPVATGELLKDFVHPPVNFSPCSESNSEARKYQGIPTIERTPGGRLWAAWYAGPIHEDRFNYAMAATSDDDDKTWSGLKFVINPDGDGPRRDSAPSFWLDPSGKLWLFWWMNGGDLNVTMSITTENPDAENPTWTEPQALFSGVMINKPIVTRNGEWLMPAAIWQQADSCRIMVSRDQGRTWTEVKDHLPQTTSRFHLRRLASGNLLLIKHNGIDERARGRNHLTAYLSDDDGKLWKGGLLLDERDTVSYPDVTQAPDGTIYVIYDWNRADEKHILMTTFREADVLAGKYASSVARQRVLINHATGVNPKPWRKKQRVTSLNMHEKAAAPLKEPGASMKPVNGEIRNVKLGEAIFSNRSYTFHDQLPQFLRGGQFVFSPMEKTEVVCTTPGVAYTLTPLPDRNKDSITKELLEQGFELAAVPEFALFLMPGGREIPGNVCSVYQRRVAAGDRIQFGKWGVVVMIPR